MLQRSLSMLLLATLFTITIMATPYADEMPGESMSKMVSAEAVFFLELNDLHKSLERAKDLSIVKLFNDPEVQALFEGLKSMKEQEVDDFLTKFQDYTTRIAEAFSGRAMICIPRIDMEQKLIEVVAAASVAPGKEAEAKALFELLISAMMNDPKNQDKITTEDFGGVQVTIMRAKPEQEEKMNVCLAMHKNQAIVTLGSQTMKDYLGYFEVPPARPLFDLPAFAKLYKAVSCKEVFWFVDANAAIKMFARIFDFVPAGNAEILDVVKGLMDKFSTLISYAAGGITFDGEMMNDEIAVQYTPAAMQLKSITSMRGSVCELKTAKFVPENALYYTATRINWVDTYSDFEGMLPESWREQIKNIENSLMLSLKDEILPALGDEYCSYFTMQGIMPSSLYAIELKNPEVIAKVLAGLNTVVPYPIQEVDFREHKIYKLSMGGGVPGPFAATTIWGFAIHDGYLLAGYFNTVQAVISHTGKDITANPEYQKALLATPPKTGFIFLDVKNLFGWIYDTVLPFLQPMLAQNPNFDPALLPSRDAILGYLQPMSANTELVDDMAMVRIKSPVAMSPVLGVIFIAISAVMFAAPDNRGNNGGDEGVF
ncbi:MAG: hypothetical protein WC712_06560 [Candidatus Brocadiia bacterium]